MDSKTRIIFTASGKGGIGKTTIMLALVDWFESNGIPIQLLDLDTENKTRGSLWHFYNLKAPKIDINTPAGLDAFIDYAIGGAPIILADMGAGSGQTTFDWFDAMFPQVSAEGVAFTAIVPITPDPASVESALSWAAHLQNRVSYLVVENYTATEKFCDFTYWKDTKEAHTFREVFAPPILKMPFKLAELENATRNHGVTLADVANRNTDVPELLKASLVMRAQSYRRIILLQFDTVKELLLP